MKTIAYLQSNKNVVEKGEEIEITVLMKNNSTVACNLYIYFDKDKFEFISGPENTNLVSDYVIWTWYDETGGSIPKENELSKFVFKAKKNGIAKFNLSGNFYDIQLNEIQTEFEKLQVTVGKELFENIDEEQSDASNTNLEMLAIENIQLNPLFDNNIMEYAIEISKQEQDLNIYAVPENENASVKISGNKDLKEGENLIKIIVTAPNHINKKEYSIKAYKRNEQEEIEYVQKDEQNKEKLENIYQAKKTVFEESPIENTEYSKNSEVITNSSFKKEKFNFIPIIIFIVFIILIVVIVKSKKR